MIRARSIRFRVSMLVACALLALSVGCTPSEEEVDPRPLPIDANPCGDGVCNPGAGETPATCALDCTCGNNVCDPGESLASCAADCKCGNNVCDAGETLSTCPGDCKCGNNVCDAGETSSTCPGDCKCGNNLCDPGEATSCPTDCPVAPASLRVTNSSSYTVYNLYVRRCGTVDWGPDQLGAYILYSGYTFTLNGIPAGCWDLRAENSTTSYWQRLSASLVGGQTYPWTLVN